MHSVLPALNFAQRNKLSSFRVLRSTSSYKFLMRLYRLGTILFLHTTENLLTVLPLYFNLVPLVSSIKFFNKNSNKVSFNLKSINRLTYLAPSALFLFTSSLGITSNLSLSKFRSGGYLTAILA